VYGSKFVHFEVICTAQYRYGEKLLHHLRTGNPTSAFKQLSSNSARQGKNRRAGDFSPKKANFGILLKNAQDIF
jgi:hypothetical protein